MHSSNLSEHHSAHTVRLYSNWWDSRTKRVCFLTSAIENNKHQARKDKGRKPIWFCNWLSPPVTQRCCLAPDVWRHKPRWKSSKHDKDCENNLRNISGNKPWWLSTKTTAFSFFIYALRLLLNLLDWIKKYMDLSRGRASWFTFTLSPSVLSNLPKLKNPTEKNTVPSKLKQ